MNTILIVILILIVIAFIITIAFIFINNSILKSEQLVEEARSGIDTQLKRRYDLIPSLIETVKGYAGYEKTLLENISKLRTNTLEDTSLAKKAYDSDKLSGSIKNIFAIAENYPDLKANQNFLDLQKNLTEIEDSIQYSRRYYNGTVREYNIKIVSFPASIVAKVINTPKEVFFTATEVEKENVEVKIS